MTGDYIDLSYWQVALAASLILIHAGVSLMLRLNLERKLVVAAVRMTVRLLLVGVVLRSVFALNRWYAVVALGLLMTLIEGGAAVRRTEHRYRGIWLNSIVSVWGSSWTVTALALFAIVEPEPWYRPQYAIPLLGMILGNTLNGISLGLDRFAGELSTHRDRVETQLALGATAWEAARPAIRESIRTGLIPTLNTMMVVGLVSLPGMMTGQLLAGVEPVAAVKYQLVIMFLIAAGTVLGTLSVVLLSYRYKFNERHQLL